MNTQLLGSREVFLAKAHTSSIHCSLSTFL